MQVRKMISLGLILTMITACSASSNSTALYNGDYAAVLPYESTNSSVKHVSLISDMDCRIQIESGLMDLSKEHFSVDEVEYKTHAFLDYDELDATDGSRGLLGTLRDDNPIGLNPSSDEEFDTGNGIATGPVILVDIYELDWYAGDTLKGVSLSMVLNGSLSLDDGSEVEIDSTQLENYFDVTSNKLVSYMRERYNEITTHIPVYIAGYRLSDDDDSYGGYFRGGYFEDSQGKFTSIEEQWVLIPSTSFTTLDSAKASEFDSFKESLKNVLTDYTYVTGQAKYDDGQASKVEIRVECHAKSAGEILAVGQMAKENLSIFTDTSCRYTVKIIDNDETYVIIQREEGSTDCNVISTI